MLFSYDNPLQYQTSTAWLDTVLKDFDTFLYDHASAEKKASGMAITMISHYPDKTELVDVMAELAIEELNHYREVIKLIYARGNHLQADVKDPYVGAFRQAFRKGTNEYMLDRLLIGGLIEARGAERFALIASAVTDTKLQQFYSDIAASEQRHHQVFFDLATLYFKEDTVLARATELSRIEADICASLPIRAALH